MPNGSFHFAHGITEKRAVTPSHLDTSGMRRPSAYSTSSPKTHIDEQLISTALASLN
jgi:hypothetical protein